MKKSNVLLNCVAKAAQHSAKKAVNSASIWSCYWTIEQLNWKLYPAGDINEYDGLTDLFVKLTENDLELFDDPYIKRWYKLSVGMK